jgi:serine/threonine-protein kinase
MSPEQLMGHTADGRSDLWGCGVILYELLTGVSPFLAETPAVVMHNVLQAEPAPPSSLNHGIPQGFDAVVARALAKKPEQRFQTAREFQAAMLMALQGKLVTGTMTLKTETAMKPAERVPVLAIAPEQLAEIERSLSRHMGPLAGVLIRKTRAETTNFDEFFEHLASQIPDPEEQAAFLKKVSALKPAKMKDLEPPRPPPSKTAAPVKVKFSPEQLELAEKKLASYVGPLARLLIKEAAGKSGNIKELYAQLAAHIDSEDERRDFLASLRS